MALQLAPITEDFGAVASGIDLRAGIQQRRQRRGQLSVTPRRQHPATQLRKHQNEFLASCVSLAEA